MTLEILLGHPGVQALGRALLHFVWQGGLLALLLWIVNAIVPPAAARLRYGAASLILLIMPLAVVVTATRDFGGEPAQGAQANRTSVEPPAAPPAPAAYDAPAGSAPRAGLSGWAVCIWIVGVVLLSARAAGGWMGVRKLKRGAAAASLDLEHTLQRVKRALRVSAPVRLCTSAAVRVPTAVGWLRPYILLPATAITGLTETQIRAILAHELAHILRHDYVFNLLQTAIETVLFYHPAVWWVSRQVRQEREHCCDDLAVAVCGSAFEYASALAEMEQIRDRIPAPALAATGGELLGRIRRVLGRQDHAPRPAGSIAAAAVILLGALTGALLSLHATPQQPEAKPPAAAFEAASVKPILHPSREQMRLPSFSPSGRFSATAPLVMVVVAAYGLPFNSGDRLLGGPEWMRSPEGVYSIDAVPEKDALPAGLPSSERLERMHSMLQKLLRERFHLSVHIEQKQMPYYALVVAKGGPKLQKADITEKECGQAVQAPTSPDPLSACHSFVGGQGRGLHARAADVGDMVKFVENWTGRPLIDDTGIKGLYRFDTTGWLPLQPGPAPAAGTKSEDGTDFSDVPTLFQVFEGLGLKMEARKGKVAVYVIDHVERPTEN